MIIDAHINLTDDGRWFDTGLDASEATALRQMDAAGVARAGVIPLVGDRHRAFTLDLARRRPDRFYTGFGIAALDEAEVAACRQALDSGLARFVKLHPRQSGILPRDPGLAPFFDLAERAGVPVIFCGYMRGPNVPMRDLDPLVYDDIARARPGLRIVIAHAGSYRPLDALAVAQSHANVYLDMSHVLEYFRGSSLEQDFLFSIRRLDRKVIYGSDFPEYPINGYLGRARELTAGIGNFDSAGFFGDHAAALYKLG